MHGKIDVLQFGFYYNELVIYRYAFPLSILSPCLQGVYQFLVSGNFHQSPSRYFNKWF